MNDSKDEIKIEIKKEPVSSDEEEDDDDDEDDDEDDDADAENKNFNENQNRTKHPPKAGAVSRDVQEGRSVFINNVSFDANEQDLREVLEPFGKLKYVLICMDPLTEHPKGSAFAQFIVSFFCFSLTIL